MISTDAIVKAMAMQKSLFCILYITLLHDHKIDFENARIIDKATNRTRKTLESWHTARTNHADNNSFTLPEQYNIPL